MNSKRKRRLYWLLAMIFGVGVAVSLSLYALRQNIDLYYTPSQLLTEQVPPQQLIRVGGFVMKNSVRKTPHSLKVSFVITDFKQQRKVEFTGILPALFREGQGVVVQGRLNAQGVLIADQVLAKHDNRYVPPGLKPATQKAG